MRPLQDMSARAASFTLYVSVVCLLVAVLSLVTALVCLVVTAVTSVTAHIAGAHRPSTAGHDVAAGVAARASSPRTVRRAGCRCPMQSSKAERLQHALVGLGFKVPEVRTLVARLGDRVEREPIEALIKAGIAALAA